MAKYESVRCRRKGCSKTSVSVFPAVICYSVLVHQLPIIQIDLMLRAELDTDGYLWYKNLIFFFGIIIYFVYCAISYEYFCN